MDGISFDHERCGQPPVVTAYTHNFEFLLLGHGYILETLHIRTSRTNLKTGFASVPSPNWLRKFASHRNNNNLAMIQCIVSRY